MEDLVRTGVVAVGLISSSIGMVGTLSMVRMRDRAHGVLCMALGVVCVIAGNLDLVQGWPTI